VRVLRGDGLDAVGVGHVGEVVLEVVAVEHQVRHDLDVQAVPEDGVQPLEAL
jgi:hypothetical protein